MKRRSKGIGAFLWPVMIGAGLSVAVTIALLALTAMLIVNQSISLNSARFVVPVVHFLALFIGCLMGGKIGNENKLYVCLCIAAVIYVLCVAAVILLFDGVFFGIVPSLLCGIVGSMLALWVASRAKKRTASRYRKRSYR